MAEQFALSPGLLGNTPIDYTSSEGAKLYKTATAALQSEFDFTSENLKVFLAQLKRRSEAHGWKDMLQVPRDMNAPLENLQHLIDSYGTITLENVRAHAETYVATQTRVAQESYQLYHCIMASLSKAAQNKVLLMEDEYYVEVGGNKYPSGTALLRVIICESIVDTNATQRHLHEQLSKLDQYAIRVNGDIEKVNQHAQDVLNSLTARGATTQDMIPNLFKAYEAVPDKAFKAYILKKKDDYDEGFDIDAQKVMKLAENKFKMLVEDGLWQAPDEQAEKIIALEAQIKKLESNKKKNNNKKADKKSNKDKGKSSNKKAERPAWMSVPPKSGESGKKTVDGDTKPWYWCPKHESWVRHTPQECKGKGYNPKANDKKEDSKPQEGNKEKLTISKALNAVMNADEDDE